MSTLKELAARWAPEVKDSFHKGSTHLALDDIRESIAELQHYRKHFIKLKWAADRPISDKPAPQLKFFPGSKWGGGAPQATSFGSAPFWCHEQMIRLPASLQGPAPSCC